MVVVVVSARCKLVEAQLEPWLLGRWVVTVEKEEDVELVHSDGFGTLFSTSLSVISVLLGLVVETVVFTLNNELFGADEVVVDSLSDILSPSLSVSHQ